ncbi:sensor histidine kinase [Leeia aquatica]|uniref:histidine kinase n=1 Tax=Leeia aquatica TaxID=2725557 RepID=A0A847S1G8_9NEIS|nr:PAS domain-containing sensor histidine kinase [Leeia aquatica]NLR75701.1 PAS domain S-box protein [Leeia aquatica]
MEHNQVGTVCSPALQWVTDQLTQGVLVLDEAQVCYLNAPLREWLASLGIPVGPGHSRADFISALSEPDSQGNVQLSLAGAPNLCLTARMGEQAGQQVLLMALPQAAPRQGWADPMLAAAPVGLLLVDDGGHILQANPAIETMFGFEAGSLTGQLIEVLLPERYRNGHAGMRTMYSVQPEARRMGVGRELFGRRADGSEFPLEIGLAPVQTPSGQGVLASVVDISERRKIEHSFRDLVQAAPYGVLVVSQDGCIRFLNHLVAQAFGYRTDELLGQAVEILIPERHVAGHPPLRTAYSRAPRHHRMGMGRDLMGRHRDGSEFPVEVGLAPLVWDGQQMVMAVVTDISARKRVEDSLRQANAHLEQFTYVASHDLRSPLQGIGDLAEWMQEDLQAGEYDKLGNNLERIRSRVARMGRVIDDLLTYARAGKASTELVLVDPQALLDNILEMSPIPEGFVLERDIRVSPFPGARTPLETVLRNLISNAIKHHDRSQGHLRLRVTEEDAYCCFRLADDGPGIPEASLERIFMLFQTASASARQGSGIGLAITRRLVESHGGRIEVHTGVAGEGRGAEFRFWWPRFQQRVQTGSTQ